MLALGTRQSFGLFLRPMSMDLGWGREAFSFAIALQNLVWGFKRGIGITLRILPKLRRS